MQLLSLMLCLPLEGALKMLALTPEMLGRDLSAKVTVLDGHSLRQR